MCKRGCVCGYHKAAGADLGALGVQLRARKSPTFAHAVVMRLCATPAVGDRPTAHPSQQAPAARAPGTAIAGQ